MESSAIQKTGSSNMKIIPFTWAKKTVVEIIALLFIMLFLYTGISKLIEFSVFKEQISESPILHPIAKFIAWSLPSMEFLVSILLFVPKWRLRGLYVSLLLMTAFTLYVIAIMTFNKELPCSCGGIISLLSWKGHLIFNSAFVILAIIGITLEKRVRISIINKDI